MLDAPEVRAQEQTIGGRMITLHGMPAASLEAIRRSQEVNGETHSYQARIFDQLVDLYFGPKAPVRRRTGCKRLPARGGA